VILISSRIPKTLLLPTGRWNIMAKKGEKYKCDEFGLVVMVDDSCGCASCELTCCGEPMKPLRAEKEKPKTKK
jgi:hypothetical protein